MRLFFGIAVGGTEKFTCALRFSSAEKSWGVWGCAVGRHARASRGPQGSAIPTVPLQYTHWKHTWRQRDAMNSFVLAQLHAVGSGAAHHAPAWAPWQRALMAASSSAYLANAVCWSRYDHPILAGVFVAVAILSTAADALSDAVFAPAALARVRTADRAVGSTALVASVVANSLSPVITACATLAALSAVSVLLWARAVARAEPKRWATYLCLQAGWHVYGAAVLCTVTWLAQPS